MTRLIRAALAVVDVGLVVVDKALAPVLDPLWDRFANAAIPPD